MKPTETASQSGRPGVRRDRQVLIFDADDTLWENNVIFERIIGDFLDWVEHPESDRDARRAVFNEIEKANTRVHGYGTLVFLRSLADCFARLRGRPASEAELRHIDRLAVALTERRVELVAGVADTLAELGGRHDLLLLTKGAVEEQRRKIEASDLAHHFSSVHIVPEKDVATYTRISADLALLPAATWMIGNSPKSDILPARRAGMNAVFIPHAHTWVLEHDELDPGDAGVLHLSAFPELLDHF
ncbi:putative hydrolase of the HAD superfamily [Sinosporangium album]|uniref:Putative hydrolase of the HAD superfamily n=1 Tax=Sinosporangium album TaxID=504805 RepID=A0A1G8JJF1_9ACTN|nr:HAD family hydrolase [Sinosporangium album]SDI31286.1 putative hydrolase of the HAD superfamily [Sinosporangium album]